MNDLFPRPVCAKCDKPFDEGEAAVVLHGSCAHEFKRSNWYKRVWWWFGYHGLYQINWWWKRQVKRYNNWLQN